MEIFLKFVGTSPLAEFVEYDADREPLPSRVRKKALSD